MGELITDNLLPPFLLIWEPLEAEQLPLQVALLTMEAARTETRLRAIEAALGALAAVWRAADGG